MFFIYFYLAYFVADAIIVNIKCTKNAVCMEFIAANVGAFRNFFHVTLPMSLIRKMPFDIS